MSDLLSQPLTLPCGVQIPNRLAKAAMTEGLATAAGGGLAKCGPRAFGAGNNGNLISYLNPLP